MKIFFTNISFKIPSIIRKNYQQKLLKTAPDAFNKTNVEQKTNFVSLKKMYPREINLKWFQNLSLENLKKYEKEFSNYSTMVNFGEIKNIIEYTEYLEKGLQNLSKGKPFKFISVGQSPALFAKIMEIKGFDTGICPISEIGRYNGNFKDIIENSNDYFKYLKNFNVDIENFDNNKKYFFVDFVETGLSLSKFKKFFNLKGIKGKNIHFISLDEIIEKANIPLSEEKNIKEFRNYYLYNSNLKKYSPIFKLPIYKLNEIEKFEKMNNGNDANISCNALLFWLLKNSKN